MTAARPSAHSPAPPSARRFEGSSTHSESAAFRLPGWSHRPRTVGGRLLLGRSVLVEVLSVSHAGQLRDGGTISAAVRDGFGLEQRLELPANISARPGTLLRIDRVNAQTIAVTNLSRRGGRIALADAADWFPIVPVGPLAALACALGAAILLRFSGMAGIAAGLALMAPACCTLLRNVRAHRCRGQVRGYLHMVCSDRGDHPTAAASHARCRVSVPSARRSEALA